MSKNHISQPSLDIKQLWFPLIREELNNRIPAVVKPNPPQIPQNRRITRSMSQKNHINTWDTGCTHGSNMLGTSMTMGFASAGFLAGRVLIENFLGVSIETFLGVLIKGFLKTAADFRLPKRRKVSATYFLLKRWRMSDMLVLIINHR